MYLVKDYMTGETVAITTNKTDALALIRSDLDRKLIVEKEKK